MRTLTAVIIDDEASARNVLLTLFKRYVPNLSIVGLSSNLEEGVIQVKKTNPDIVLLDVQMPNYNGYEITQFFDEIHFEIIFVTAFDKYAIKAFELNAVDYLVKPVNRERLKEAVEKASDKINTQNKLREYSILYESFQERKHTKIIIPEQGGKRILEIKDIICMEADGSYSKIYLTNDNTIIVGKNLKYFESTLRDIANFFRIHRAWLVNLDHIKSINKGSLRTVLSKGLEAKISRKSLDAFEQNFTKT